MRLMRLPWLVVVLLAALFPVAGLVADAPENYLEVIRNRSYPDRLFHVAGLIWDCPVTREAVDTLVKGELIRSRLHKPTDDRHGFGVLYLSVDVSCIEREAGNPVFRIDVDFEYLEEGGVFWKLDWNYGTYGVGAAEYILDVVEDRVEMAITDFIRAHDEETD